MANLDLGLANQIDRIYEYMSEQFYSISTMRKGNKARFTFSYSFYWNWLTETQFLPLLENQISRIVNWPKCSSSRWNSSRWLFTAKGRLRFSNLSSRNRTDGDHSSIRLRKSMKKKVERERTKASSRTSSIRAHCLILLFLSRSLDNSIFSSSIFFSCQSQFHNWSLEHCRRERERERERERDCWPAGGGRRWNLGAIWAKKVEMRLWHIELRLLISELPLSFLSLPSLVTPPPFSSLSLCLCGVCFWILWSLIR